MFLWFPIILISNENLTISIVGYTLHFVFMGCYVKGWRELPTPKQPLNRGLMSVRSPKLTLTAINLLLFSNLFFLACQMPKKKVSIFPKENNNPLLGLASINDDGFETCAWIGNFMLWASNGLVCKKDFWKNNHAQCGNMYQNCITISNFYP